MRTMLILTAVALLVSPAAALEGKQPIDVKITVKGMSCPDGCAPVVTKELKKLDLVKDAKLADFKAGTFALKVDGAKKLSPLALQEAIGTAYVLGRIETTFVGTITNASGVKYALKEAEPIKKSSCKECPLAAAKAKKEGKCDATLASGKTLEQIGKWLEEGKTTVQVTGDLDEFCPGKVVLGVRAAKPVSTETSKN